MSLVQQRGVELRTARERPVPRRPMVTEREDFLEFTALFWQGSQSSLGQEIISVNHLNEQSLMTGLQYVQEPL